MKRLACLLFVAAAAAAIEVDVGSTRISIPVPDGYAVVTDEMQPYAGVMKRFVPAACQLFAMLVPDADAARAAEGGLPRPRRFLYALTLKDILHHPTAARDFAELKRQMKAQNEHLAAKVEEELPGLVEELGDGLAKDHDVSLSVGELLPLPPHQESDRSLAFSLLTKFDLAAPDGSSAAVEAAITATVLHIRAKVLFLYVAGERADLAWTRDAGREWADAVVAANPSTGDAERQERGAAGRAGLVKFVLAAALAAAVVGAFLARRRRT